MPIVCCVICNFIHSFIRIRELFIIPSIRQFDLLTLALNCLISMIIKRLNLHEHFNAYTCTNIVLLPLSRFFVFRFSVLFSVVSRESFWWPRNSIQFLTKFCLQNQNNENDNKLLPWLIKHVNKRFEWSVSVRKNNRKCFVYCKWAGAKWIDKKKFCLLYVLPALLRIILWSLVVCLQVDLYAHSEYRMSKPLNNSSFVCVV